MTIVFFHSSEYLKCILYLLKMSFKKLLNFTGQKEDERPTSSDAIRKLRDLEDMLVSKQEYLEKKIETELQLAKQYGTKNKRLAIQSLRRKKRFEKQLQQIDGTLSSIENQREALENVHTNSNVLKTMKFASDALKRTHQTMDIDKVHDMMDDIAEQQDIAKEIADAISNPTAFPNYDIDEDELEKELEELYQLDLDNELLEPGPAPHDVTSNDLPSVPSTTLSVDKDKETSEEADELMKLEQWAT